MNFRALSANTCNARFNITPIATVNVMCGLYLSTLIAE